MRYYHLKDWVVIEIAPDAANFLKGLSTNTLETPFNAFVNIHGRIISVVRQQKISEDVVRMALVRSALEPLTAHLSRYTMISASKIKVCTHYVYVDCDSAQWFFEEDMVKADVGEEEFKAWRLNNRLALQGVDFQADEFILNVDNGQYVSFAKGCFLGQEPVAKVHNRSKPSKKLVVKGQGENSSETISPMTSVCIDSATGRARGFVFVKNN